MFALEAILYLKLCSACLDAITIMLEAKISSMARLN